MYRWRCCLRALPGLRQGWERGPEMRWDRREGYLTEQCAEGESGEDVATDLSVQAAEPAGTVIAG